MKKFELLLVLTELGAARQPVKVSESAIGGLISMSQQTVSRRIREAYSQGLVSVDSRGISLTEKGKNLLKGISDRLSSALSKSSVHVISAEVFSGMGDGKYYLSLPAYKESIKKLTGLEPYPGTLNLRIPEKHVSLGIALRNIANKQGKGFHESGRTFGGFSVFPCRLNGEACFIIIPERTHYDNSVLELISKKSLRKSLGLKDGDLVELRIEL